MRAHQRDELFVYIVYRNADAVPTRLSCACAATKANAETANVLGGVGQRRLTADTRITTVIRTLRTVTVPTPPSRLPLTRTSKGEGPREVMLLRVDGGEDEVARDSPETADYGRAAAAEACSSRESRGIVRAIAG